MTGPDACKVSAVPGSGPFKMVAPKTLCGMPDSDTAYDKKVDAKDVSLDRENFDPSVIFNNPYGPSGTPTSGWETNFATPEHLGVYRFAIVEGWTGKFNPKSAMWAFGQGTDDSDKFKAVAPGPHGGVMECAEVIASSNPNEDDGTLCVFATSTTLGKVQLSDSASQLTAPANLDKVAQEIRDAIEVPAS